jgi:hypothetical protein
MKTSFPQTESKDHVSFQENLMRQNRKWAELTLKGYKTVNSKKSKGPKHPKDERIIHELLLGFPNSKKLFACNFEVRSQLTQILAEMMKGLRERRIKSGYHFYAVTTILPSGYFGASETYLNLKSEKEKHRKIFKKVSANFFAIYEMQLTTNSKLSKQEVNLGDTILGHMHGVCWTKRRLTKSEMKSLTNEIAMDAAPLTGNVSPIVIKEIGDDLDDIANWVAYMAKFPFGTKRVHKTKPPALHDDGDIQKKGVETQKETLRSNANCNPKFRRAFRRLAEILSQIEIGHLLMFGGEGIYMRKAALAALRTKLDTLCPSQKHGDNFLLKESHFSPRRIETAWQREEPDRRQTNFEPPKITLA